MRVDDRGDGVGGVVEAVDELEAERDQQRDEQQKIGQIGRHLRAGLVDVDVEAVGDEQHAAPRTPKKMISASGFDGVSSFGLWDDAPKSADPCSGAVISVMDPSDVMLEAKGNPPCMTGV